MIRSVTPAVRGLAVLLGALAVLVGSGCAASIRTPKRHEVGFLLGSTPTMTVSSPGRGDVELQSTRTLQAYYAYRVTNFERPVRLELEIPLLAVPGREVSAEEEDVPAEYAALFLVPGVKVRADTSERLFFTGNIGAGWARFREDNRNRYGTSVRDPRTSSGFGFGFGAGLGIQVTSAIDVRLEVRGVSAKRELSFDEPGKWVSSNMGFFGVDFRF